MQTISSLDKIKMGTMKVSEVFGPVCQGEGIVIGRPTIFVRFGGCDYHCNWCDSLYAVEPQYRDEWASMTVTDITDACIALMPEGYKSGMVTLSGGNPAIQPGPRMLTLIDLLHYHRFRIAIETQGSVAPNWLAAVDDLTLSPKPPTSGNVTPFGEGTPLTKALELNRPAHGTSCLKVVVFDDEDYAYAKAVHMAYPGIPFFLQAGTLVNQATRDDLCDALDRLQERALADPDMQDVAVLPQLHAILKGHARGI